MPMIRKCTKDDLIRLRDVAAQTFDETFRPDNTPENMETYMSKAFTTEKIAAELDHPNSYFYFIYKDELLAGFLKLNVFDAQTEPMGDDFIEIERIYILKEFQKHGLGKQLLQFAFEFTKARKYKKVWLGVWEKNLNVLAFYRRYGFEKVDSHDFYMGDDRQTDWIMVKEFQLNTDKE